MFKYYASSLRTRFFRLTPDSKEEMWDWETESWIPWNFYLEINEYDELEDENECMELIRNAKEEREILD